ncbi:hypothetical protein AB0E63_41520 [Kribbella sp. NPDC026596]|uniref:hypothetical protein n=1 Tax=Kribbella sp. NPDC026596 TaxID=3155122 RepID=UPI0033CC0280
MREARDQTGHVGRDPGGRRRFGAGERAAALVGPGGVVRSGRATPARADSSDAAASEPVRDPDGAAEPTESHRRRFRPPKPLRDTPEPYRDTPERLADTPESFEGFVGDRRR